MGSIDITNAAQGSGGGTVVLFQYNNQVVASATLLYSIRFECEDANKSGGGMQFDVDSIRTFPPVGVAELRRIWPSIKRLDHGMRRLKPSRYASFLRFTQHGARVFCRQRPTIGAVWARRNLRSLRPMLKKWTDLNANLARQWLLDDGDVPWWYTERTLLGLFSSAVWLSGGVSLEEYSDAKRELSARGAVTDRSYTGRADLYFESPEGARFRVEAKRLWLSATSMKDPSVRLRRQLT